MKALWGKRWETEGILRLNSLLKTDKMCEICQLGLLNICYCCSFQLPKGTYTHQDSQDQHGDSVHTTWYHCTQNREQTEEGQGGRRSWRPWHLCWGVRWGGGRKIIRSPCMRARLRGVHKGRSLRKKEQREGEEERKQQEKKHKKTTTKEFSQNCRRGTQQTDATFISEWGKPVYLHPR